MGGQGSGGAHGGPQYSPTNVSATGGAGQSGQAKMYIPGMSNFGVTGKEVMAQQGGAAMYSDAQPTQSPLTPITAPTELPNQHVMDGSAIGPGANYVPNLPSYPTNDPDMLTIQNELPIIEFWASQPGASQGTKDYVSYLKTIVANPGGMA